MVIWTWIYRWSANIVCVLFDSLDNLYLWYIPLITKDIFPARKWCKIAQHLRTYFTMYFNYIGVIGYWSRYWKFKTSKSDFELQNFLYFPIKIRIEELLRSVFTLEFLPLLQLNEHFSSNWHIKYSKNNEKHQKGSFFFISVRSIFYCQPHLPSRIIYFKCRLVWISLSIHLKKLSNT